MKPRYPRPYGQREAGGVLGALVLVAVAIATVTLVVAIAVEQVDRALGFIAP